ncbi:MAG TPA: CARDB domain-containing protein [Gemmatimonadales bacterium]
MGVLRNARGAAAFAIITIGATFWSGCSDQVTGPLPVPSASLQATSPGPQDVSAAIAAQERHTPALRRIPGVIGTAVGLASDGRAVVRIFLSRPDVPGVPDALDGIPVSRTITGMLVAFGNPTTKARPAPLGYSIGHPSITAGTIGALVRNGSGQTFVLSNNHVLANGNDASLGDPALQPGPFDGGTLADQIGTLFAFKTIDFALNGRNTIDAALALTSEVSNSTPLDDGYGTPGSSIYHDTNDDGLFDNLAGLLNTPVQKYGRTTKLTKGTITGINASLTICYEVVIIFCVKSANFVDQLIIEPGTFSGGGDSGSLIVTDDLGKNPVGLLFAGSSTQTIANRIDLVLNHFGVAVDGGSAPPPTPTTDAAVTTVTAPSSVSQGTTVNVAVVVMNVGTEPISTPFNVTLQDATDGVPLGTQSVASLAAGAVANLSFSWNTTGASLGDHTLTASHSLADDNGANNQRSAVSTVNAAGGNGSMHIGDLDGISSNDGTTWSAIVEITVHDANHAPLNGATIVGSWSRNGLNANTCTSGDLGGIGTCIVLFPSLSRKSVKSVTFTVNSVTMAGRSYVATSNHDVDGGSNGTSIKLNRP